MWIQTGLKRRILLESIDRIFLFFRVDSIISDIPLNFEDNGKIGDFRYEGCCENGYVKNTKERSRDSEFKI